jgi:hypothetical protein
MTDPVPDPTPDPQIEKGIIKRRDAVIRTVGRMVDTLEVKKASPIVVHWYDRAWLFMQGKKRATGIALMLTGATLWFVPGVQVAGWKMAGEGVFLLGSGLTGVGVVNKSQKDNDPDAGANVKQDWTSFWISILKKIFAFLTRVK